MIKDLMSSRRFAPLFGAQFFSALNDNVLKNALVIILLYGAASGHGDALVTVAGAVFIFPYFILSAAMSVVTIHFTARSQYLVSYEVFPFGQRLVVSGNAIFEYCRLLLCPVGITPLYVIPDPIPVSSIKPLPRAP